jgi:hypothetical protein
MITASQVSGSSNFDLNRTADFGRKFCMPQTARSYRQVVLEGQFLKMVAKTNDNTSVSVFCTVALQVVTDTVHEEKSSRGIITTTWIWAAIWPVKWVMTKHEDETFVLPYWSLVRCLLLPVSSGHVSRVVYLHKFAVKGCRTRKLQNWTRANSNNR